MFFDNFLIISHIVKYAVAIIKNENTPSFTVSLKLHICVIKLKAYTSTANAITHEIIGFFFTFNHPQISIINFSNVEKLNEILAAPPIIR